MSTVPAPKSQHVSAALPLIWLAFTDLYVALTTPAVLTRPASSNQPMRQVTHGLRTTARLCTMAQCIPDTDLCPSLSAYSVAAGYHNHCQSE
jgi:hypothetical protein